MQVDVQTEIAHHTVSKAAIIARGNVVCSNTVARDDCSCSRTAGYQGHHQALFEAQ